MGAEQFCALFLCKPQTEQENKVQNCFPLLTTLSIRNPHGINCVYAARDLWLQNSPIKKSAIEAIGSFILSRPARHEFHPCFVRPTANELTDSEVCDFAILRPGARFGRSYGSTNTCNGNH